MWQLVNKNVNETCDCSNTLYPELNNRFYPSVDISGDDNETVITMDLPGFEMEDINVTVDGQVITIEGEKKGGELSDGKTYYIKETGEGKFSRSFKLPYEIDNEKISAMYVKGVLKLILPRTEKSKPKKVTINAA